jgi:hypothetical protein
MESRPLLYMKPRLENTAASPSQIRHVVYHLETALALMPEGVENLCIIIDFAGSSMTKNPGVAVAREIINVLGSHYPERLGKAYIIHGMSPLHFCFGKEKYLLSRFLFLDHIFSLHFMQVFDAIP